MSSQNRRQTKISAFFAARPDLSSTVDRTLPLSKEVDGPPTSDVPWSNRPCQQSELEDRNGDIASLAEEQAYVLNARPLEDSSRNALGAREHGLSTPQNTSSGSFTVQPSDTDPQAQASSRSRGSPDAVALVLRHAGIPSSAPPTDFPRTEVERVSESNMAEFRRLHLTLFAVAYTAKYFSSILPSSALCRVALWHQCADQPAGGCPVVGAISCRIEVQPPLVSGLSRTPDCSLYVQTLGVLAPHRGRGVAVRLLEDVLREAVAAHAADGLSSVYAHVWQESEEALAWYRKRGFDVERLCEGYYRKLRPAGAWLVRRRLPTLWDIRKDGRSGGHEQDMKGGNGVR